MRVLVGCECSQRVCHEFRQLGHDAFSCDIKPCEGNHPEWHIEGDMFEALAADEWDMLIAFPPCTYLTKAGAWLWELPNRQKGIDEGLEFVRRLMRVDMPYAIENPPGLINTRIRKPDQIIQPYWFGEPFSKQTCLWLSGLPPLKPTNIVPYETGFTDNMTGGKRRSANRSITFEGVAKAMAEQWSSCAVQLRFRFF